MYKKQLLKAKTMKDIKKLYPKAQKTSEVHGAKFYIELDKSKKLYAGAYSEDSFKSVEPFDIESVYVMKGKNPQFLYRESVRPIKLKDILSEIEEVSDDTIIKYKDKDGEPKEMPAKSAKSLPHEHPAKKAWDIENEKEKKAGGGEEKPDPSKLSGSDFQRSSDLQKRIDRDKDRERGISPASRPTPFDDDEDIAYDYEDKVATGGGLEDVTFDDFDMKGNPIYMAKTMDGDEVEVTVDRGTGEIYDYYDDYRDGFDPDGFAYGNVHESSSKLVDILISEGKFDVVDDKWKDKLDDLSEKDFNPENLIRLANKMKINRKLALGYAFDAYGWMKNMKGYNYQPSTGKVSKN